MSGVDVKVVLLGREYCGKTSLTERYLTSKFADAPYQNTIGAAYGAKMVQIGSRKVVLGIWDTAGSERYQAMSRIYYRSAFAALICYDVTDADTFERAKFWIKELLNNEPSCKVYLVGTKTDRLSPPNFDRAVPLTVVEDFAKQYNAQVTETSAKTGENVSELFEGIVKDWILTGGGAGDSKKNGKIRLGGFGGEKKGCCGSS